MIVVYHGFLPVSNGVHLFNLHTKTTKTIYRNENITFPFISSITEHAQKRTKRTKTKCQITLLFIKFRVHSSPATNSQNQIQYLSACVNFVSYRRIQGRLSSSNYTHNPVSLTHNSSHP
ncbi:hypothetical protein VIGAN_10090500 [Vigna angularis var. angularis]|uniref:Uncharacterized protein n=1 Tax=Vigna angularis var. angularis TaxID=157739 RepID=A0A0S3T2T6_PHAAN|nr:hypothetical protein VIGAN_10090500 [Vigna angularis var. angularis]